MYVEKVNSRVTPVSPLFLKSDSTQLDQHKEAFREIIQQALNNRSNSRPPKIELRGVLVPCGEISHGRHFAYKLETDSDEYLLGMSDLLIAVARKAEWEEVNVKGSINFEENTFEVERISLARMREPVGSGTGLQDVYFDEYRCKQMIAQQGSLAPAPEYLVS